ncbi:MAG: response regulator [Deltaproteobacteria bacterium]|nr:response regulator [Deltaproteobacteria bacterium]
MSEALNDKKIAEFLAGKRVLLVDPDATTRTTTQRMLSTLGIKNKDVLTAWNFHDAVTQIEQFKPEIVLTDYTLERHSGIELLNLHKRVLPNRLHTIFMFISSRNSNTIACLAAAEEVDAFMIKPFSFAALKDKFIEVLSAKAYAPEFLTVVERAKFEIHEKRYGEAQRTLAQAKAMDPAPAVVCYYEGMAMKAQNRIEDCQRFFEEGLRYNPVHYRCLTGLLDVLIARKRYDAAYDTAHKLTQNYPIEPTLIPVLIRLSISSKNFTDILKYYDIFEDFEEKDAAIVNYISAGLIVCAKFFFETGRTTEGLNALNKAEAVSDRKPQIMKEILATLYGVGLEAEATALLDRAPPEVRNSPDVAAAKLEKLNVSAPPSRVLQYALDLVAANVKHPRIFEIALLRSVELMHRESHVKQLLATACAAFPDRKDLFERAASQAAAPSSGANTA